MPEKMPPDSTRELIAGAEALIEKKRGKDPPQLDRTRDIVSSAQQMIGKEPPKKSMAWLWIVLVVAAGGAAAYWFLYAGVQQ